MLLTGRLNLIHTVSKFKKLINDNRKVFHKYFGVSLFPGSLNVRIDVPDNLQGELDKGNPSPDFIIPKKELVGMPKYIGNGQAWKSILSCHKFPAPFNCWIFRRVGSRVPKGIVEIVAEHELVKPYGLQDGDTVTIQSV